MRGAFAPFGGTHLQPFFPVQPVNPLRIDFATFPPQ
jgi:hypothetical protein